MQTGCSNGRCRSLKGGQERVDVGQFPGLVGLVRRADGAVRVGGIQIKDPDAACDVADINQMFGAGDLVTGVAVAGSTDRLGHC